MTSEVALLGLGKTLHSHPFHYIREKGALKSLWLFFCGNGLVLEGNDFAQDVIRQREVWTQEQVVEGWFWEFSVPNIWMSFRWPGAKMKDRQIPNKRMNL